MVSYIDKPDTGSVETQEKTVTPSSASQDVIPDTDKYLSKVIVNPVPIDSQSTYYYPDYAQVTTKTPASGKFFDKAILGYVDGSVNFLPNLEGNYISGMRGIGSLFYTVITGVGLTSSDKHPVTDGAEIQNEYTASFTIGETSVEMTITLYKQTKSFVITKYNSETVKHASWIAIC